MCEIKINELPDCHAIIVKEEDLEKAKEILKKENINMYKSNSIYISYYDFEAARHNIEPDIKDEKLEEISNRLMSKENIAEMI